MSHSGVGRSHRIMLRPAGSVRVPKPEKGRTMWLTNHPRAAIAVLGSLLIAAGAIGVGSLSRRNLRRIESFQTRVADLERIRDLRHRLEVSLLDEVRESVQVGSFLAEDVRLQVENALALESYLDPQTALGLRQIEGLLTHPGSVTRSTLVSALELAGSIAQIESQAQMALLANIREDSQREFLAGLLTLGALMSLTVLGAWLVPKRLLNPLSGLGERFPALAEGDFQEVPIEGVEPSLFPLFSNYNAMVARMSELEDERKARSETLEEEVRRATRALTEQHRTLANAERMAAVGETAAGVAHELRNPLAGMLASLENLQRELTDAGTLRRVGLLRAETERVVGQLNEYLSATRHEPEPLAPTDVGALVEELLALLRYQVPDQVSLQHTISPELVLPLPRDRFRQAILNLVWNAVEALAGEAGTVGISAHGDESGVSLEVFDTGPGFGPDLLEEQVQAFRTRRDGGTGLGLAMAQRTVRDLGGTLKLSNRTPSGAAVLLFIPRRISENGGTL